ncbi:MULTISPECIES: YbaB/EbfC family nucleoid-associated protein [unclassified Faecalibacterium]|uniref:YbaB/EbfC family nucleoid-associated protein n=1 Tax=unclassified Faecalibacterium TaxID=2646395 RepID=UPI000B381D72|nr:MULTISPECIES: YbaB/EbfC family nucleoid-associated protein [unclassified Faecalibacterium]OUN34368.1 YbaB/EbfC family nucleoid-associated protein [Faecalibacterium sp. An77]OUP26165.1 YbaB/EbfC family nucleoid-associated protein [Faecalibacterium sp. An192]OUQ33539.1 YbaB/EbfC family nucleoid-associated protein [Faecalibacterium sp. An122]
MKARMPGGYGRPDMNSLMRQAQKMQSDMQAKQAELEQTEYTASAPGEMVTVTMNGKHQVVNVTIKPEAVDPDDIEMLQDLVAAAVNAVVETVDQAAAAEMGKLTGGLNIPGLGL